MQWFKLLPALPYYMVYGDGDDASNDTGNDTGNDTVVVDDPPTPKDKDPNSDSFTKAGFTADQQKLVNSLLKSERLKTQNKNQQLIAQLETQKNQAATTELERQNLEERIASLKAEFQTERQLALSAADKKTKGLENDLKKTKADAEEWRKRHHELLLDNSLTQAAVAGKAYNPRQVVTILKPMTRVVEVLDDKGVGTGSYEPKVKLSTTDKDGNAVVLELDPMKAVKQLSEMGAEYDNLFISPATGGLGGGNRNSGSAPSIQDKVNMPLDEYYRKRKEEKASQSKNRR